MAAFETDMQIEGNLTSTPELKTKNGQSYTRFLIAKNDRVKVDGQWEKGERTSVSCVAYDQEAEMICRTFQRGHMVVAAGRFTMGARRNNEGVVVPDNQLTIRMIGASPRFATVHIEPAQRAQPETGPVVAPTTDWAVKAPGSGLA